MFGERELAAVTDGRRGRPLPTAAGAMLSGHPVRPRRLHDQAALVPAGRFHARACSIGGGRPTCCGSSPGTAWPASAGWRPSWRCCSASPTSTSYDLIGGEDHRDGRAPSRRRPWSARPRERIGAAYSIRYSSTESGGVGTATAFDADDDEALFTVGRPRPGVEIEIRDAEDRRLPAGRSVRSACARRPSCAATGADPEATAATIRDGWVHSGDLGLPRRRRAACAWPGGPRRCSSGAATTCTRWRSRRCSRRTPAWPRWWSCPGPTRSWARSASRSSSPDDPVAPPTLEELRSFGAGRLSAYKLPEALRITGEIPLTPMQKIDRKAMARTEAGPHGTAGPPRPVVLPQRRHLGEHLPVSTGVVPAPRRRTRGRRGRPGRRGARARSTGRSGRGRCASPPRAPSARRRSARAASAEHVRRGTSCISRSPSTSASGPWPGTTTAGSSASMPFERARSSCANVPSQPIGVHRWKRTSPVNTTPLAGRCTTTSPRVWAGPT